MKTSMNDGRDRVRVYVVQLVACDPNTLYGRITKVYGATALPSPSYSGK